jgi:hypothetical protein
MSPWPASVNMQYECAAKCGDTPVCSGRVHSIRQLVVRPGSINGRRQQPHRSSLLPHVVRAQCGETNRLLHLCFPRCRRGRLFLAFLLVAMNLRAVQGTRKRHRELVHVGLN